MGDGRAQSPGVGTPGYMNAAPTGLRRALSHRTDLVISDGVRYLPLAARVQPEPQSHRTYLVMKPPSHSNPVQRRNVGHPRPEAGPLDRRFQGPYGL
jgi:hypothetical protein